MKIHCSNRIDSRCAIGLYGGKPSDGVCSQCDKRDGLESKQEPEEPTIFDLASNFIFATKKWVEAGFPVVNDDIYNNRFSICKMCDFWDDDCRSGLGKCKKCGCTKFKRWLATEHCPEGKWAKVDSPKNQKD